MEAEVGFQQRLLVQQNAILMEHGETLKSIAKSIETLEKHSLVEHSEEPFPETSWKHEPVWLAVLKTATAKTMEQAELWKSGMDSNLIFVALFVTIVTAFQVPVSQNLSQNPADVTNEILNNLTTIVYQLAVLNGMNVPLSLPQPEVFSPARSDEIVTLVWYTSLIMSVMTAILAVFGRQWVGHLTRIPHDTSNLRKAMRHKERQELADKLLAPILNSLHPILIMSISLFVIGLIYQLWNLSLSSVKKSPLLISTSVIGTVLIIVIGLVVLLTLTHAIHNEESPFSTSISSAIRPFLPSAYALSTFFHFDDTVKDNPAAVEYFCQMVPLMTEGEHLDDASAVKLFNLNMTLKEATIATDVVVRLLQSDTSMRAKLTAVRALQDLYLVKEKPPGVLDDLRVLSHRIFDACRSAYNDAQWLQTNLRLHLLLGMGYAVNFGSNFNIIDQSRVPGIPLSLLKRIDAHGIVPFDNYLAALMSTTVPNDPSKERVLFLVHATYKHCNHLFYAHGRPTLEHIVSLCDLKKFVETLVLTSTDNSFARFMFVHNFLSHVDGVLQEGFLRAISAEIQELPNECPSDPSQSFVFPFNLIGLLRNVLDYSHITTDTIPREFNVTQLVIALTPFLGKDKGQLLEKKGKDKGQLLEPYSSIQMSRTIMSYLALMKRETMLLQQNIPTFLSLLSTQSIDSNSESEEDWSHKDLETAWLLLAQFTALPPDIEEVVS